MLLAPRSHIGEVAGLPKQNSDEDPMRTFRLIGGIAAFLAALGIFIMGWWFILRAPRF